MIDVCQLVSGRFPSKQRALILQGGGALGAYEVGVFKAIYNKIIPEEEYDIEWKSF